MKTKESSNKMLPPVRTETVMYDFKSDTLLSKDNFILRCYRLFV